jgi:hypothetical protein
MELLVTPAKDNSKLRSTIGILALFDVLKHILQCQNDLSASTEYFFSLLEHCKHIDFSDDFFSAAGVGRGRIKNAVILCLTLEDARHDKVVERIKRDVKDAVERLK